MTEGDTWSSLYKSIVGEGMEHIISPRTDFFISFVSGHAMVIY